MGDTAVSGAQPVEIRGGVGADEQAVSWTSVSDSN